MNYISILGNIGAGKTEVAKLICQLSSEFIGVFEDDLATNPYANDFSLSPDNYALRTQVHFVANAVEAVNACVRYPNIVQDFSLIGCIVFADAMRQHGYLSERDYETYERLLVALMQQLPAPSLYILVEARISTLHDRIHHRGRITEDKISEQYLYTLQQLHDIQRLKEWLPAIDNVPFITIDTDQFDVLSSHGREHIADSVLKFLTI